MVDLKSPAPGPAREARINWTMSGVVDRVSDGDTLALRLRAGEDVVIRFSDIDTPEKYHVRNPRKAGDGAKKCSNAPSDGPGQPSAKEATQSLVSLASVGSNASAECYEIDGYSRAVCHVFINGNNLNLEQLRRGMAMVPTIRNTFGIHKAESR